jgi:hypothetical protein
MTSNADTHPACFICGRPAESFEHVVPKWLQHRFDLWDQELELPNGTSIRYRQLTIPSCTKCNSEVYGALERRVENGTATESDIWKWTNKIHYGLGYKDQLLEWDRRHPRYKIGDVVQDDDPLEIDRHFLHCVSGDFKTQPDPFGSLFRFDFPQPQPFRFAHIIHFQSVCMSVGERGFVVFVTDGQALCRDKATTDAYGQLPKRPNVNDMLFFFAQCLEHRARHKLGFDILMKPGVPGLLARIGPTVVHAVEPPNDERFRYICKKLGLEWIDSRKLI